MSVSQLVEMLQQLRKLQGKFEKDIGIQVLSKHAIDLLMVDKTVTTTPVESKTADCRNWPTKILYFQNLQDVDVYVDVLQSFVEKNVYYPVRSEIKIPAQDKKWGFLGLRTPYLKISAKTLTQPTTGTFHCALAKWGV